MESLLYVAVALATTAKIYHTKRETLQTAKELFTVPLMYDPRFQVGSNTPLCRPALRLYIGPVSTLQAELVYMPQKTPF